MHSHAPEINVDEAIQTEPIRPERSLINLFWACFAIGIVVFALALVWYPPELFWAAYYTNVVFWMGLSLGGVVITAILQIVRATWSAPVRRVAEANVAFLPWAYLFFLGTYFGKSYLFPWGSGEMPGRVWWMQGNFVYARFAVLLGFLFYIMYRYVNLSLRGDIGLVREKAKDKKPWLLWDHDMLTRNWKGSALEVPKLQNKMSCSAPVLIIFYVVIYSLFSMEMVMGMDKVWYSNLFGGFMFIGNIYVAWAVLTLTVIYLASKSPAYRKVLSTAQLWDLGKLTFAFCMLWGYLFFSQFLPQWYGNIPEETQWLIIRARELPWRPISYFVFSMCFIVPFILLLGEDLKKTPPALATVCFVIFLGMWLQDYVIIMPELSPEMVPFGVVEAGLFFGFLGLYGLSVMGFLARYPYLPVSHPATRGVTDW